MGKLIKPEPYIRGRPVHHSLSGMDTEDDGRSNFLSGGIVGEITKHRQKTKIKLHHEFISRGQKDFITALANINPRETLIVGYNTSYDKYYFQDLLDHEKTQIVKGVPIIKDKMPYLTQYGQPIKAGSNDIKLKLLSNTTVIDLHNHMNRGDSLEDCAKLFDMDKQFNLTKIPFDDSYLKKVKSKETKLKFTESERNTLDRRVRNDAALTWQLGNILEDFYTGVLGIPLKSTVGQASLMFYLRYCLPHNIVRPDDLAWMNDLIRPFVFGGRADTIRHGWNHADCYDMNKAYLSIYLSHEMPNPESAVLVYKDAKGHYKNDLANHKFGLYHVLIETPKPTKKNQVMLLPHRRIDGSIEYPAGTWWGYYPSTILVKALKENYKILDCDWYIFYRNYGPYFKIFGQKLQALIYQYAEGKNPGDKGFYQLCKRLVNCLWGKLLQVNRTEQLIRDEGIGANPELDKAIKQGQVKAVYDTPEGERYYHIAGKTEYPKHYMADLGLWVPWGQQENIYDAMKANEDNLLYSDTDSIWLKHGAEPKGIELAPEKIGAWKFQEVTFVRFINNKAYIKERDGNGQYEYHIKAIPGSAQAELLDDRIIFRGKKPIREKEAAKHQSLKQNTWRDYKKVITEFDSKRRWHGNDSWPNLIHNIECETFVHPVTGGEA